MNYNADEPKSIYYFIAASQLHILGDCGRENTCIQNANVHQIITISSHSSSDLLQATHD